jgi:hypothetical protein
MSDGLIVVLLLAGVIGVAAVILFVRDRLRKGLGRRYVEPTAQIAIAVGRFLRPAVYLTGLVIFAAFIFAMVSENRGSIACLLSDNTGSLSRACALHKITTQAGYGNGYVVEITGIADITENVKRVEFDWQTKPDGQNPNRRASKAYMTFRKYDDGWRPEGGMQ